MRRGVLPYICFLLVLVSTEGNHWSEWSSWSECSRTCDGGATYQERKCVRSPDSKDGCEGERFRYSTCNNDPCSPDSVDFRGQQCAAYNNATYGGKLYTWLPYTDRKNPCTLYCIPKGTRTVVRLAPKVLDGTRCKFNAHDMCISGKCWPVGCDHKLDSPLTQDLCGVCGGNNSCLNNGTKGRYHWIEIGLTPCSASCGVGVQTYQYRCRDRLTGNQVPESRCVKAPKPNEREKSCFRRQCPPVWKIFTYQACTVSCGGGTATRAVRCMDTLRDGRQQWLHDSFCPVPKPSTTRPCNPQLCPRWYAGEWSPCSVTCGWGEQIREVVCRHEGEMFCDSSSQPVTRRNCTTIFPCNDPDDPRNIAEHDEHAGRQELVFGFSQGKSDNSVIIKEDERDKYNMTSPKFVVSSWSACSATCGVAFRTRYVRCQVLLKYMRTMEDLPDAECSDQKPPVSEQCDLEPCYNDYKWVPRGLTPCSRSCLGGTQETHLECVHKSSGTIFPEENCAYTDKLPIERKVCNEIPCPQRWRIGDFGECSTTCGGGNMTREVNCIQQVDVALDRVLTLPDIMCERPVPPRSRECNTQLCPANWASGAWSQCSVTCGTGVELRPVVCQRVTHASEPVDVNEYHCPPTEKPASERLCNVSACPELKIKVKHMTFFQINLVEQVRLFVGAEAMVLPRTAIIIMCPVKGIGKKRVEWLKDDRPIIQNKRITVSRRGNLKILRSKPKMDTGKYTCLIDQKRASIQLIYPNFEQVIKQADLRTKYFDGFMNNEFKPNSSSATYVDPFDKKVRPLQLIMSDWSNCSSACGRGVRRRKITCEIITNNYFEGFPMKICKRAGMAIPKSTEVCNSKPCTKWAMNDWSPCLNHNCTKDGYSIKMRTVNCTNEIGSTIVSEKLCDASQRPVTVKECRNKLCRPTWKTSDWSECLAQCGESGYQTRMLTCVWEGNDLPAGRICESLVRPVLTRQCFNNCTHECVDASDYCTIVPVMKLCRISVTRSRYAQSGPDTINGAPGTPILIRVLFSNRDGPSVAPRCPYNNN
ncbi:unnamed protein product [Lymnaea stagnalis]|uniref:Ig-like domain-containing protein n=1 Tax=Lymnaea stagnalis TaxID=6523 RepID=A0AAV2H7H8_LYMST